MPHTDDEVRKGMAALDTADSGYLVERGHVDTDMVATVLDAVLPEHDQQLLNELADRLEKVRDLVGLTPEFILAVLRDPATLDVLAAPEKPKDWATKTNKEGMARHQEQDDGGVKRTNAATASALAAPVEPDTQDHSVNHSDAFTCWGCAPAPPVEQTVCEIKGPYYPVGDVDWECRTHGATAVLVNPSRYGAKDLRRSDFRCSVGAPQQETPAPPVEQP